MPKFRVPVKAYYLEAMIVEAPDAEAAKTLVLDPEFDYGMALDVEYDEYPTLELRGEVEQVRD